MMESKHFLFNPNEAKAFANYFSGSEDSATYGVVTSMISRSTFSMADISLSIDRVIVSGSVATFYQTGLSNVNADARRTGGIKLTCTTPSC